MITTDNRSAPERKGGKQSNRAKARVTNKVLALIDAYATEDTDRFDDLLDDLIERDDFDGILSEVAEGIVSRHPGFKLDDFKKEMLIQASSTCVDFGGFLFSADLFFVPVCGTVSEVAKACREHRGALAKALSTTGLTKNSTVVLAPFTIDAVSAGEIMPGQLRAALYEFIRLAHAPDGMLADRLCEVLGIEQTPEAKDPEITACNRLLVGFRLEPYSLEGKYEPDWLTAWVMDNLQDEHEGRGKLLAWEELANATTGGMVMFGPPSSLPRGCARIAIGRLAMTLDIEADNLGIDPYGAYDEIHVAQVGEGMYFEAVIDGHTLGPVDIAASGALIDSEWFTDVLSMMGDAVVMHDTTETMFHAQRKKMSH